MKVLYLLTFMKEDIIIGGKNSAFSPFEKKNISKFKIIITLLFLFIIVLFFFEMFYNFIRGGKY